MRVRDSNGREGRVRRRWLTIRRPRWRRRDQPDLDGADGGLDLINLFDDPISGVIGLIVLIVFVVLLGVFFLPLVLFLGELLLLIPLALLGVLGRLLLRRPWVVEARSGETVVSSQVAGWRASSREISRLAAEARAGRL